MGPYHESYHVTDSAQTRSTASLVVLEYFLKYTVKLVTRTVLSLQDLTHLAIPAA